MQKIRTFPKPTNLFITQFIFSFASVETADSADAAAYLIDMARFARPVSSQLEAAGDGPGHSGACGLRERQMMHEIWNQILRIHVLASRDCGFARRFWKFRSTFSAFLSSMSYCKKDEPSRSSASKNDQYKLDMRYFHQEFSMHPQKSSLRFGFTLRFGICFA